VLCLVEFLVLILLATRSIRLVFCGFDNPLSGIVAPQTILPGAMVNLRLARLRGTLPRGRHRVGVRLTQAGHRVGGLRTGIRLR